MTTSDYEYFARRARQEDRAARQADCIEARISHKKLADAYRRRCIEIFDDLAPNGRLSITPDQAINRPHPVVSSRSSTIALAGPSAAPRPFCRV